MIRTRPAWPAPGLKIPKLEGAFLPAAAAICSLVIYLLTMAPSAFPLDSSEMAAGAATLGIVHSPGYPVYLLLTHLFSRLPAGDLAYRANLASAVYSALAAGLLVTLVRDISGRSLAALAAGFSFAFCFYTWSLSVVAEVYTLQALLLVLMLCCVWRWRQQGRSGWLIGLAFLLGLAAANNPATILWWPGLLLLALSGANVRRLDRRDVARLAIALTGGLAFVLYIPIRSAADPAVNYIGQFDGQGHFHRLDLANIDNLLWYLSGRQFDWAFFAYSGPELVAQAGQFIYQFAGAFLGAGLIVALWGCWRLLNSRQALAVGLLLVATLHGLFFIAYRAPDKETMFLPVYLIAAVFLGAGLARMEEQWPRLARLLLPALIIALVIINKPFADVSDLTGPRDVAEARLKQAEPNAFYLAVWGDAAVMEYLQVASGLRTDVTVINILMIAPATRNELVAYALGQGRMVYSSFSDPALRSNWQLRPVEHGFVVSGNEQPP